MLKDPADTARRRRAGALLGWEIRRSKARARAAQEQQQAEPARCPAGHLATPENRLQLWKVAASGLGRIQNGSACRLCRRYSKNQRIIGSYSWLKKERSRSNGA